VRHGDTRDQLRHGARGGLRRTLSWKPDGLVAAANYLIEEEEGLNDHNVVGKCAEIQNAISEGEEHVSQIWCCLLVPFDLHISL
jgi:hypothetical protein